MRATVHTPISKRSPDSLRDWVDREGIPALTEIALESNVTHRSGWRTKTGASAEEIWFDTMPADSAWSLRYRVMGRNSAGQVALYHERRLLKRTAGGTPASVQTTVVEAAFEDDPAWSLTIGFSSNGKVTLTVSGTDVRWVAEVEYLEIT